MGFFEKNFRNDRCLLQNRGEIMRVAINGFGRIGRSVFRILNQKKDIEVVAINDIFDKAALAYLLKYDTVMGRFSEKVSLEGDMLNTESQSVKLIAERDPSCLPWAEMGIDVLIESTGIFRQKSQLEMHLNAGAKRVIITVPAKDEIDYTVVLGVNDDGLKPEHKIISNASCTTNCLAPMAKVLDSEFGIELGVINTIHAYTNDQRLADVPHSDWRRSRAAAENVIPTTTGAAKAVGKVLPELEGKLDGIAMRVPVPDGSVVDFNVRLKKDVKVDEVNDAVYEASKTGPLKNVLQFSTLPVVSTDIIGNPHSSIFDAPFTRVIEGNLIKTLNWYDNEWGYSNRVADLIGVLGKLD
jgi:glyceraldehyde 3-phosphate dehydrogenase